MRFGKEAVFRTRDFDTRLTEESAAGHDPLPLFRQALREGRERLRSRYFEKPADTPTLIALHAWLVDQLLVRAWRWHLRRHGLDPQGRALLAVGGYGRGELHPASDVDILVLAARGGRRTHAPFAEDFVRFLWDMGLEVGHAVRTVRECVNEARRDVSIATNLMEARFLAGDQSLARQLEAAAGPRRLWPSRAFFAAKLAEQRARHARFEDTAYNLEPNVKDGPGGLRDIQTIAWVAQRHFATSSLHDLVRRGFLSESEYRTLVRARHFLWTVRAGLHYFAGRREDRLLFDHQRALARLFGFRDRPGILAVEQFMKRYYRTVKAVGLLNEILLQHFEETLLVSPRRRARPVLLDRRFQSRGGFLEVRDRRLFERHPIALIELFHLLQRHPELKGVRADTIRLVLANLHRIDTRLRRELACQSLFMAIFRHGTGLTHALRRMNAYGVLGRYLPAFGRIVGQMQHDLFHVYTVDAHILMVVRNLRRLTVPAHRHELPFASELMARIVKPERLYLAALFHDIAKGRGGDHSELGAKEAEAFARRHHLSEYDTRFIAWLVRHHLLMSQTAQRRDIYDPDVVREFARAVGDQEHLDNLYLLTVADMRGTSPAVWNAWKGRLLTQLYSETSRWLARGIAEPIDLEAHIADLKREALARLDGAVPQAAVEDLWENLDADYFLRYDADSLAWHARTIAAVSSAALPLVAARSTPELGGSEFLFYAPDREGLFAVITGGFDRLNLNIVEARIHTLKNGFALDTFVALDHRNQPIADQRQLEALRAELRQQLLEPRPGRDPRSASLPRTLKHFPIETRVSFSPSTSKPLTIMEVVAQDRPGLLHQIALALQRCGVNLVAAKVSTYGERAEDIFFLNTRDGRPLADPAQTECLRQEILARLAPAAADAETPTRLVF
jgi:[protein-PII] uridylyltransferase